MMGYYEGNLGYSKEFSLTGIKETLDVFEELANEIGDKKATSRFLLPAMKQAMAPVLTTARLLAPRDTNKLASSLVSNSKRPTSKDKRSIYVSKGDVAIAKVEVLPIAAKHKQERKALSKSLWGKHIKLDTKKFYESKGYFYDARAIATEFGTKNMAAKPYLRPALEGQTSNVLQILSTILNQKIQQYRSKTAK